MKDLKAFMAKVSEDQGLAKKVMAAKDSAEVVSIAAAAGYKFTEDDLMDEQMSQVAGGGFFDKLIGGLNAATNTVNQFKTNVDTAKQNLQSGWNTTKEAAGTFVNTVKGSGGSGASGGEWQPSDLYGEY